MKSVNPIQAKEFFETALKLDFSDLTFFQECVSQIQNFDLKDVSINSEDGVETETKLPQK